MVTLTGIMYAVSWEHNGIPRLCFLTQSERAAHYAMCNFILGAFHNPDERSNIVDDTDDFIPTLLNKMERGDFTGVLETFGADLAITKITHEPQGPVAVSTDKKSKEIAKALRENKYKTTMLCTQSEEELRQELTEKIGEVRSDLELLAYSRKNMIH